MLLGDARRLLQLEEAARQRLAAPRLSGTVRLGVVEEIAGGSLPSALGRFAALHPGVKLEVQIGVSAELIEQLNSGRLDVVFAKRPLGTSSGRLVWREALVWAASDTFDFVPGAALPLALYRERSVSREAALAALRNGKLTWEIVYTSPSLTGVRAAALAGLAVTPLPASAVVAGLRVLGAEEGLPRLPDLEFAIYEKARSEKAVAALAIALRALAHGPSRPTI
jgi:DNA-binding transcriptional LysR family regulator